MLASVVNPLGYAASIDSHCALRAAPGYPLRDNSKLFSSISRIPGKMYATPGFRSARHPQRKTDR